MPVFILGPERSGTSLAASWAHANGYDMSLGDEAREPDAANPKGYFEAKRIVALHNEIFERKAVHRRRRLYPGFELPEWHVQPKSKHLRAAAKVCAKYRDKKWGWKDPHGWLVAPMWAEALARAGMEATWLILVRHPDGVYDSALRRSKLEGFGTTPLDARLVYTTWSACYVRLLATALPGTVYLLRAEKPWTWPRGLLDENATVEVDTLIDPDSRLVGLRQELYPLDSPTLSDIQIPPTATFPRNQALHFYQNVLLRLMGAR